jgi:hypothetical protein
MKFAIINPTAMTVRWAEANEVWDLYPEAGLPSSGHVDHGIIAPYVAIVVYEFSLFVPPKEQRYFAIGRKLFGGPAILYGFSEEGITIDLPHMPQVFFMTVAGIEDAIERGQIDRPTMAVNGEVIWQWPGPAPASVTEKVI